jgi:hypothetical protein
MFVAWPDSQRLAFGPGEDHNMSRPIVAMPG